MDPTSIATLYVLCSKKTRGEYWVMLTRRNAATFGSPLSHGKSQLRSAAVLCTWYGLSRRAIPGTWFKTHTDREHHACTPELLDCTLSQMRPRAAMLRPRRVNLQAQERQDRAARTPRKHHSACGRYLVPSPNASIPDRRSCINVTMTSSPSRSKRHHHPPSAPRPNPTFHLPSLPSIPPILRASWKRQQP